MTTNEGILKALSVAPVSQLSEAWRSICGKAFANRDKVEPESLRDILQAIHNESVCGSSEFVKLLCDPALISTEHYMYVDVGDGPE